MKNFWLPLAFAGGLAAAPQSLSISPSSVQLIGPEARQQLIAEAVVDSYHEDWTRGATWTSSNPGVVTVDATGLMRPAGDGEAVITAAAKGQSASVKVQVKDSKAPFQWSFKNHVMPVLTKSGCNQGACHGALAGKNGFKLTLRGYDPDADYDTLTRQSIGRRISLADPAASLILLKPSFGTPHGGGKRFAAGSLEYRVIAEWIANGTPPPSAKDKEVVSLEVFPKRATLKPGSEQQLVVRAKYSDGTIDDVTRWVKYNSNNEGVATVDDNGRVKMNGNGEAAVTLWYSSRVLYATLTSPYPNQIAADAYDKFPKSNYIDEFVLAKLKSLHITPSPIASDTTFIRRAYLDAAGILPSPEEVEQFLADKSPDKRAKMIDRLLERDEFVDYWAYKWSDLLLVSSKKLRPNAMWAFYNWIRDSVKVNKPWDQFARDIFTGSGSTRQNGALNYFVLHKDTIDLTENVTQAFLGQRLTCARCHNHPLEKWTQKQYYQMANLFSRVGVKNADEVGDSVIFAKTSGEINHPRLLRPLAPTPLDGQPMALEALTDRRIHFSNWLTSPKNEYFAKALVNRVWGNFLGRGIVNPIDDVRATNPPSNEELFAAVTKDFIDHKFDVKQLIRTIMNSTTYQLSSETNATNQDDKIFYSKYIVKRLPAESLLDAMSQVTGVPTGFGGYPAGTRAMQLPDTQVVSQFLNVFGRPARNICDSSERSVDPTIAQALHVINGDTLNKKLSNPEGYISLLLKLGLSDSRVLEHMTLSAFGRYPNEGEKQDMAANLAKARAAKGTPEMQKDARRQALEDMVWAMLTSKEFIFNH
ncbi:MAG TPA: DUF1549 domain-containing protein [Bryobacteraceae bacterium]|nr:DUF1549 domain-containing protein [Bryobacteraceae bacterium]